MNRSKAACCSILILICSSTLSTASSLNQIEIKSSDQSILVSFPSTPIEAPKSNFKLVTGEKCEKTSYSVTTDKYYLQAALTDCPTHFINAVDRADAYKSLVDLTTTGSSNSPARPYEVTDVTTAGQTGKEIVISYPKGEQKTLIFVRDHTTIVLIAGWNKSDPNAIRAASDFLNFEVPSL